jgi:hypothetical protein
MRRSAGMSRGFAGGQISKDAMHRSGFHFGTTSETREPLRPDDGGLRHNTGSIRADHAVDPRLNRPTRGSGFTNPQADYGPRDMGSVGHIDGSGTRPQYPSGAGYTKQADRPVKASDARSLRGSASETWMGEWYGYPSKRQGG